MGRAPDRAAGLASGRRAVRAVLRYRLSNPSEGFRFVQVRSAATAVAAGCEWTSRASHEKASTSAGGRAPTLTPGRKQYPGRKRQRRHDAKRKGSHWRTPSGEDRAHCRSGSIDGPHPQVVTEDDEDHADRCQRQRIAALFLEASPAQMRRVDNARKRIIVLPDCHAREIRPIVQSRKTFNTGVRAEIKPAALTEQLIDMGIKASTVTMQIAKRAGLPHQPSLTLGVPALGRRTAGRAFARRHFTSARSSPADNQR